MQHKIASIIHVFKDGMNNGANHTSTFYHVKSFEKSKYFAKQAWNLVDYQNANHLGPISLKPADNTPIIGSSKRTQRARNKSAQNSFNGRDQLDITTDPNTKQNSEQYTAIKNLVYAIIITSSIPIFNQYRAFKVDQKLEK